jgi:amphi-Trp domain-containing protein
MSSKQKSKASKKSSRKSDKKKSEAEKTSAAKAKEIEARATQSAGSSEDAQSGNREPRTEKSGKQKTSVEFESPIQLEEAVVYFETIIAGLKKGTIHLKQDGEELTLTPTSQLDVRVKASRKKEKEKLSFQIMWRTAKASELQISSE